MKTLLILFPYSFNEISYFQFEIFYLEKKKNYKIIIHDLSNIVTNKQFNKAWKSKKEKRAIKFTSLISWIHEFNKIRKKKNILIYDLINKDNFKSFVIKLLLMLSNRPILRREASYTELCAPKQNLRFFLSKVLEHKLNLKIYSYYIKEKFFSLLVKCMKFKQIFLMTHKDLNLYKRKENVHLINCHSVDYSNSLLEKYKNQNKINKKQFIVYFDNGFPYFTGDTLLTGRKLPENNTEKYYKELNLFFDNLERFFKTKVLIIPHPKYRIPALKEKNLIPYFNNRLSDNSYNAGVKFVPKCLFVISGTSLALSYPVINYKPVQFIYSSNFTLVKETHKELFLMSNLIGMRPINTASFESSFLIKNLKINKAKYDLYKFKFLTYKKANSEKPNHEIIKELMDKSI